MRRLLLASTAGVLAAVPTAYAQTILKASVSGSTLTISGTALAGHVPIVQLAGTNLTVLSYSATIVTATMPPSVPPGSY